MRVPVTVSLSTNFLGVSAGCFRNILRRNYGDSRFIPYSMILINQEICLKSKT